MMRKQKTEPKPVQALRKLALGYPEVEEGTSCNRCSFKANEKAFFFMGTKEDSYNAMFKLADSQAEARKLEQKEPEHYKVGNTGWVTITFANDELPPAGLLKRWIDESYRLLVPAANKKAAKKKVAKKKAAKKKAAKKKTTKKQTTKKQTTKKQTTKKQTKKKQTKKKAAKKKATRNKAAKKK